MRDLQYSLSSLYDSYGYRRYRMNKFEQYDLYARNKDFLLSEHVITFTDTNGALMALKPDVTLSIIKNGRDGDGVQKVYYNEKVYRPAAAGGVFREIDQMGLECIGADDTYTVAEVVRLAAESLLTLSEESVLVLSHPKVVEGVLTERGLSGEKRAAVLRAVAEKNGHELSALCSDPALSALATLYGSPAEVISVLRPRLSGAALTALRELETVLSTFKGSAVEKLLRLDFSVAVGAKYYGGIAFEGFVDGLPERVLSGGCYDPLMRKMGRSSSGMGFAIYLDQLARLGAAEQTGEETLLLYSDRTDPAVVFETAATLRAEGKRVRVETAGAVTDGYAQIITLE